MTERSTNDPQRMSCMEIWGGNRAIDRTFEAPGLDIYVHSRPFQGNDAGGDIYYLTSCASGRISRFLLADVSGHGSEAAGLAKSLRDLLRQNVNKIKQGSFVSAMNRKFGDVADDSGFATAVVATFFEPTQLLDISVAGHPYPIYYHAKSDRWVHLDPAKTSTHFENMPLGVMETTNYPGRKVKTESGDMFLLYTDAFIESARDNSGESFVGTKGIVELLNANRQIDSADVIPYLRESIGSMAQGNLIEDDASLILGHFTESKTGLKDKLLAPMRMFRQVADRTEIVGKG